MPLRTVLRLAMILAALPAVLAVLPARAATAAPGPALSVSESDLATALSCPRSLAGATRTPVLLVPGTALEPRANFDWNYEPALEGAGIPWCALTLPNYGTGDIQDSAEYVVHALRRMHAESGRRVSIVGYSQGGMVGRWALKWWPDTRAIVEDVVGLSPTNHGTLDGRAICVATCSPAFWQQIDRSRFFAALNGGAETFAGIDYTVAFTRYDEIVTPNIDARTAWSPLRTGDGRVSNIQMQDVCPLDVADHLAMGSYDPVAWAVALDALDHDGPAEASRIGRGVCTKLFMPGVDAIAFAGNYARYAATIARAVLLAQQVPAEPPLRCYVTATCPVAAAPPTARSACAGRRGRVTLRLDRRLRHARVTVGGRRVRVRRHRGRLVAVIDLRRRPGVVTVRIRGVTRRGRKVSQTRRYRACVQRPASATRR
jgi:pimeloyl-ACP methyl ester carboxylesterase